MQYVEYLTPFASYNPGFTNLGWTLYGSSYSHSDYSNNTGVQSGDLSGKATYEHILTADDLRIPARAAIQTVRIRYTLGQTDLGSQGGLSVVPYLRYENSPPIYGVSITPAYITSFADYTADFPRDPNGGVWARQSIFRLRGRRLIFGLRTLLPDPYLISAKLLWSECRFGVFFLDPIPVLDSGFVTLHGGPSVDFHGTLDPRSATAACPVAWWFEYGKTTAYGFQTTHTGGVVGDGPSPVVSAGITFGLVTLTTYHYRLVAETADGRVFGNDVAFVTL